MLLISRAKLVFAETVIPLAKSGSGPRHWTFGSILEQLLQLDRATLVIEEYLTSLRATSTLRISIVSPDAKLLPAVIGKPRQGKDACCATRERTS